MIGSQFGGARTFAAVTLMGALALGGWLAFWAIGARIQAQAETGATTLLVRVVTPEGPAALDAAVARVRVLPFVQSAEPLSRARIAALLDNAGGDRMALAAPAQVRLLEVRTRSREGADVRLGRAMRAAGFDVEIFAGALNLDASRRTAHALHLGGWIGVATALGAVFLFLSGAMHSSAIAVIGAETGAPRARILSAYGRAGADFGFRAGLGSAILCILVAPLARGRLGDPLTVESLFNAWPAQLGPEEVAATLLAPLALAGVCALAARAGAARAHAMADTLG